VQDLHHSLRELTARDARLPKPLVVAMKSVCDFGNEKKDKKYQAFAAHMSASVAKAFIERFIGEIRAFWLLA
jgi:hypothetical protein